MRRSPPAARIAAALTMVCVGAGDAAGQNPPSQATAASPARRYTLPELIDLARAGNPGLRVGAASTEMVEAQLLEARRSRLPSGDLLSLVAPAPEIRCVPNSGDANDKAFRQAHCDATNVSEATLNLKGVFTRTELRLVQPLFTFGKIDAAISAGEAGVDAARAKEASLRADLDANVRRAYWGLKTAREALATLDEGLGYVDEAQKQIDKELAEGSGSASVTDRLRLRTVRAEAEARVLEARRMADFARNGLRALLGSEAPREIEIDDAPLDAVPIPERPLGFYEEQARLHRPEVKMLDYGVLAKRSLADLERRKQYPDFVLLGTATFAYASSIDNPRNAFSNDPFNTLSAGLAAALRMPLDVGPRHARAERASAEAREMEFRRREALGGIAFEVQRAHGELTEAMERAKVVQKGERAAKAWITAVAQNLALGLAETRDFADALTAFFAMRIRYLQTIHDLNLAAASLARATGADVTSEGGGS